MKTIIKIFALHLWGLMALGLAACEYQDIVEDVEYTQAKVLMPSAQSNYIVNDPVKVPVDTLTGKINIPLGVYRSGLESLESFSVTITASTENIPTDAETVLLPADAYTLPTSATVAAGQRNATFYLSLDRNKIQSYLGKKLALAVSISNPTKYTLNEALSKTTVVFSVNEFFGLGNVTAKYLKNTGPFARSDGGSGRWGTLKDWTVTTNLINQSGNSAGGYTADNGGTMQLESKDWSGPGVSNGKIYQTTELPAGSYTFEFTLNGQGSDSGIDAHWVATAGTELPDINNLGGVLGKYSWDKTLGGGTYRFNFDLPQKGNVTLGVVASFGTATWIAFGKVTLIKTK